MNRKVVDLNFPELANRNLQDLMLIEEEIFDCNHGAKGLIPKQPKYWDIQEDGTVPVFLRCD